MKEMHETKFGLLRLALGAVTLSLVIAGCDFLLGSPDGSVVLEITLFDAGGGVAGNEVRIDIGNAGETDVAGLAYRIVISVDQSITKNDHAAYSGTLTLASGA
jgi:hypothetical protein